MRDDASLNGAVVVTVEVSDEMRVEKARYAFGEFDIAGIVETDPVAQ